MDCEEFIRKTVLTMPCSLYEKMKEYLIDEKLISFCFFEKSEITKAVFAEKLTDYFSITELKAGKNFNKIIENYISDLNSVAENGIAKPPKHKKDESHTPAPRARRYYDIAVAFGKKDDLNSLTDYTRIMMCLYTALKKSEAKEIKDFDYSADCLDLLFIMDSLKNEKNPITKKSAFKPDEMYGKDSCTFIILIIMIYYIKSFGVEE